jgi:hypothetical protein
MYSFHLADFHILRRGMHRATHVHRCHVGDVKEGAMEHLYVIIPFVRDHDCNTCSMFSDRLENKHLSNMEEYRVTREVSLPYSFDVYPSEEYIARLQLRKRLARLS